MPHEIVIQRVSQDGLSKEEWNFECKGLELRYCSHFTYNKSNKRHKWADQEKKMLSFKDWLKKYHPTDYAIGNDDYDDEYESYQYHNNPVLQKTKQGKSRLSGVSASIDRMPACPDDVAKEALELFKKSVKVVYK